MGSGIRCAFILHYLRLRLLPPTVDACFCNTAEQEFRLSLCLQCKNTAITGSRVSVSGGLQKVTCHLLNHLSGDVVRCVERCRNKRCRTISHHYLSKLLQQKPRPLGGVVQSNSIAAVFLPRQPIATNGGLTNSKRCRCYYNR